MGDWVPVLVEDVKRLEDMPHDLLVMTAVVRCGSSVGGSPIIATFSTPPNRGCSRNGCWAPRGVVEER